MLMKKSSNSLAFLLRELTAAARARGLNDAAWASLAKLRKETLSRLRRRTSCDFQTLQTLAYAVGFSLEVRPERGVELTPDGHFPAKVDRDYEERLLALCALRSMNASEWAAVGPPFFMAGLAMMVASLDETDRRALIALAEQLHPGMSEPSVFAQWLARSPVRPSRFFPMLSMELKHAA